MKSSKPYLNPELTLSQLAEELDISVHFLSQVINEMLGAIFLILSMNIALRPSKTD